MKSCYIAVPMTFESFVYSQTVPLFFNTPEKAADYIDRDNLWRRGKDLPEVPYRVFRVDLVEMVEERKWVEKASPKSPGPPQFS